MRIDILALALLAACTSGPPPMPNPGALPPPRDLTNPQAPQGTQPR